MSVFIGVFVARIGQFVVAVALSDLPMNGDSSSTDSEYTQVFDSEQTDFNGGVSDTPMIKIMFVKEGRVLRKWEFLWWNRPGCLNSERGQPRKPCQVSP